MLLRCYTLEFSQLCFAFVLSKRLYSETVPWMLMECSFARLPETKFLHGNISSAIPGIYYQKKSFLKYLFVSAPNKSEYVTLIKQLWTTYAAHFIYPYKKEICSFWHGFPVRNNLKWTPGTFPDIKDDRCGKLHIFYDYWLIFKYDASTIWNMCLMWRGEVTWFTDWCSGLIVKKIVNTPWEVKWQSRTVSDDPLVAYSDEHWDWMCSFEMCSQQCSL